MQKKILSYILAVGVGVAASWYFLPKEHIIEEKIVYKDRTKTQIVEIITERPDGTRTIERVIHKDEQTDIISTKKEVIPSKKDWAVGGKYDLFTSTPVWSLEVQRRIIGNVYAGAYGRTDGIIGVGVTLLF